MVGSQQGVYYDLAQQMERLDDVHGHFLPRAREPKGNEILMPAYAGRHRFQSPCRVELRQQSLHRLCGHSCAQGGMQGSCAEGAVRIWALHAVTATNSSRYMGRLGPTRPEVQSYVVLVQALRCKHVRAVLCMRIQSLSGAANAVPPPNTETAASRIYTWSKLV